MEATSPLEKVTLGALDSFNPFRTQVKQSATPAPEPDTEPEQEESFDEVSEPETEPSVEKRKPGRPRVNPLPDPSVPKRKPGRPPKTQAFEELNDIEPIDVSEVEASRANPIQVSRDQYGSPSYRVESVSYTHLRAHETG
jgi:hypothetical protein